MTVIRFTIPLEQTLESELVQDFATTLQEELRKEEALSQAEAAALGEGRSAVNVAAAVLVALPVIMEGAKTIDALLGVWEKFKKLQSPPKKTAEIFANISPDKILVDVDGVLVPLTKLTEEHIKKI